MGMPRCVGMPRYFQPCVFHLSCLVSDHVLLVLAYLSCIPHRLECPNDRLFDHNIDLNHPMSLLQGNRSGIVLCDSFCACPGTKVMSRFRTEGINFAEYLTFRHLGLELIRSSTSNSLDVVLTQAYIFFATPRHTIQI